MFTVRTLYLSSAFCSVFIIMIIIIIIIIIIICIIFIYIIPIFSNVVFGGAKQNVLISSCLRHFVIFVF